MILKTEKDKIEFHFLFNLIVKEQTNELDREKNEKKTIRFHDSFQLAFFNLNDAIETERNQKKMIRFSCFAGLDSCN